MSCKICIHLTYKMHLHSRHYFCIFTSVYNLDQAFDQWVHTDRRIAITLCAPDSLMAEQMGATGQVLVIVHILQDCQSSCPLINNCLNI